MTGMRRRQFLVGTGVALAQTAIVRRSTQAGSSAPPPPPDPPVPPAKQAAANVVQSNHGAAPGYIVSGRGQDLSNPYFRPQGGPSNRARRVPPDKSGPGVDENDQGQNQNDQGGNKQ
jgi:hypothetical protein